MHSHWRGPVPGHLAGTHLNSLSGRTAVRDELCRSSVIAVGGYSLDLKVAEFASISGGADASVPSYCGHPFTSASGRLFSRPHLPRRLPLFLSLLRYNHSTFEASLPPFPTGHERYSGTVEYILLQ